MSKLGISNDDRIIIYDRLNSRLSTRLFWTLKYFGHEKVQVLDGGYSLWKSKSFPLSTKTSKPADSKYKVTAMNKKLLAEMKLVNTRKKLILEKGTFRERPTSSGTATSTKTAPSNRPKSCRIYIPKRTLNLATT